MKPPKPVSAELYKAIAAHNARAMELLIARAQEPVAKAKAPRNNPYAHGTTRSKLHGVRFNK